jgi:hypothetical protein
VAEDDPFDLSADDLKRIEGKRRKRKRQQPPPEPPQRLVDGATFVFGEAETLDVLWGRDGAPAWASGQGVMLCGPQGVGKSTVAQQLVFSRLGVGDGYFLDMAVKPMALSEKVLYLAMDRPPQIAASMRRMVEPEHKETLADRLVVWKGPLPFDVVQVATADLADWCEEQAGPGCDVLIDSYKDLHHSLSDERVGAAVNMAVQELLVRGMQWVGLHHQRKSSGDNKKPNSLDDVYGSNWLTAGLGSVLILWSKPGSPAVELSHLKPLQEPVGALLRHDHAAGRTRVQHEADLETLFLEAGDAGLTDVDVARHLFGETDRAARKRAERRIEKLETENFVRQESQGKRGGRSGGGEAPRWVVI